MPRPRSLVVTLLLAGASLGGGCGEVAAGDPPRPTIVLVALDSVPARSTGVLGGSPWTPVLDRLAVESLTYTACLAPEPWTPGSLAATLGTARPGEPPVADGATLAARLARAGYRTHAVLAHDGASELASLAAGFEQVERLGAGDPAGAPGPDAVEAALAALARNDGRPAFVVVHLADPRPPHHLYPGLVPEADAPYLGPVRAALPHAELLRLAPTFAPEDFARLRALAASEVAAADASLGALLDGLARLALAPEAVVGVFGTRGAWLGEGGRVGLLPGLEPEVLHVPLVLRIPPDLWPAQRSYRGVVDLPVTLDDVAPTLLDLLGIAAPAGEPGRSVLPGAPAPPRLLYLATRRVHPMAAVYGPGAGLVRDLESGEEHLAPWPVPAAGGLGAEAAAARAGLALALDTWLGPRAAGAR